MINNLTSQCFLKNCGNFYLLPAVVAGLYLFASPFFQKEHSGGSESGESNLNQVSRTSDAGSILGTTMPIEKIVVGQRVLAKNPELSQQERSGWKEPEWENWVKLFLVMPKPDGSELKIELLRPESWVLEQVRYHLVEKAEPSDESLPKQPPTSEGLPSAIESQQHSKNRTEFVSLNAEDSNPGNIVEPTNGQLVRIEPSLVPLSPLRPVYRELLLTSYYLQQKADESGAELAGLSIQTDLPELGLTGNAVLTNIEPAPEVKPGKGRVVTATFHHSSGDVIDLTVGDRKPKSNTETIGTTSNHPFWSVDRQAYIQAGDLKIGETLKTFKKSKDQKVVISQLPRPGPTPVYNLEVHGEHVYYVGQNGILVHNNYSQANVNQKQYKTPYNPLSSKARKTLKAKKKAGTITREEYKHLEWDRRFANRRAAGVRRFWAKERRELRAGNPGTRNWSPEQRKTILAGKTPKYGGDPVEGHHLYNALDHPHIANEAWNIYPASYNEHFKRWHGGNWRNDTFGRPVNSSFPEEF